MVGPMGDAGGVGGCREVAGTVTVDGKVYFEGGLGKVSGPQG
jgi:hypothetical protein